MSGSQPSKRRLEIGHTGITWADDEIEASVKTIAGLGFSGIEVFSWIIARLKEEGRLDLFDRYQIPLLSSYFSLDIVNPDAREREMQKIADWGAIVRSLGAEAATVGGNGIPRRTYDFNDRRAYIIETLNEMGKGFADVGLRLMFHPHTGTPVETEPEIRAVLDGVDPERVGFAPDVGQIQKGGADPLAILRDYLPMVGLVHLKDFCGRVEYDDDGTERDQSGFCCYSPLGQGVVALDRIMDLLESSEFSGPVLVELDRGEEMPMSPEAAATVNRDYLARLGYDFKVRR